MKKTTLFILFLLLFSNVLFTNQYLIYTVHAASPTVSTNTTTNIMDDEATLRGYLNIDGGENCSVWFEWGLDTGYGNSTKPFDKITSSGSYGFGSTIRGIDADDEYIYAAGTVTFRVYQYWKSNLTKKAETASYGGEIYALAIDSNYVYAGGSSTNKIYQYWKSNLTKKAETASYGGEINALVTDGTHIYAAGETYRNVVEYYTSNLTKKQESLSYGGTIYALSLDDTYIYAGGATTNKVYQYYRSNLTKKSESASYGGTIYALDDDTNYIYAAGGTTQKIYQYWKSNLTKRMESANYGGIISALKVDNIYTYAGGWTTERLYQYYTANLTKLDQSDDYGGNIRAIKIDDDHVYFSGSNPSEVWKYKTKIGASTGEVFTSHIEGLSSNTTYHYRSVALNNDGVSTGSDMNFTTYGLGSVVSTNVSTNMTSNNVTLNGYLTYDGGENCIVGFQYGTTVDYGDAYTIGETLDSYEDYINDISSISNIYDFDDNTYARSSSSIPGLSDKVMLIWDLNNVSYNGIIYKISTHSSNIKNYIQVSDDNISWTTKVTCSGTNTYMSGGFYDTFRYVRWYITNPNAAQISGMQWRLYTLNLQPGFTTGHSFIYNLTGLNPGTTYHYRSYSRNSYGFSYGSDMSFTTHMNVTILPTTNIDTTTATINGYAADIAPSSQCGFWINDEATVDESNHLYNVTCTGTYDTNDHFNYDISGLDDCTNYYVRSWVNSTDSFNFSYNTTNFRTLLSPPTNITSIFYSITQNLTISWNKTTPADYTMIRRKTGEYPTSITDGELVDNITGLSVTDAGINIVYYYSLWTYNSTYGVYSTTPALLELYLTSLNVYDETTGVNITSWNIEISDQNGSEVYLSNGNNNTYFINVSDIPTGDNVIFVFSADGYISRSYLIDVVDVVNLDAYLAPDNEPSLLKTTSRSVSNPAVNLTITLDCVPEIIVSVQGWNSSYYGHWFEIPNDKYTVSDDEVEVDESCLDANTSLIKVTYYCSTEGAVQYLLTVYGPQGEYGHDPPINNAKINIKRYMNTTGQYETVSIVATDGNGNADVYLMPGTLYRFTITKTGYNTENATKTLTETLLHHIFRLSPVGTFDPDDPDSDVFYDNFWADITITATLYENNTIHILFLDSSGRIVDTQIRVYDYDNNTETYLFVDSRTGEDSFSFWRSVSDASHDHKIRLWFNTSAEYNVNIPVVLIVYGVGKSWDDLIVKFDFDERFTNVFGSFTLGYANTLCVLIAVLVIALFGPFHAGAGIILSGFSVILMQALYVVWTTNANGLLTTFGVLALCLGILHAMTFKPEEQI